MKKYMRLFSIVLTIATVFSSMSFAALAAEHNAEQLEPDYSRVDKYFAYDYTIWDKSGNDITATFYSEMTSYYEAGD